MQPFSLPINISHLRGQYVNSAVLSAALRNMSEIHMRQVLRLWVMQGIPYAFDGSPMIYEALRDWLAPRLEVSPLDITLIGSARMGYSLSSAPKYGKEFGISSDLDFAVISQGLFDRIHGDFRLWQDECDEGRAKPADDFQRSSLKELPRNILAGFIDPKKIPTRYRQTRKVMSAMDFLSRKMKETPESPTVSRVDIRVYESWDAFQRRLMFNMNNTKSSLQ